MKKYGMLMFSILALLGAFFPVAKSGIFYLSIFNVGGIAYLLYVVPLAAIALSIVTLYKNDVQHVKTLYIIIAGIGIGLCAYSIYQGMQLFNYIGAVTNQVLNTKADTTASAIPAGGGWMMLLGYCGIIAYLKAGIFDKQKEDTVSVNAK